MSRRWQPAMAGVVLGAALALAGCGGGGAGGGPAAGGAGAGTAARAARAGVMSVTDAKAFIAEHPEMLLLDVREPAEWNDRFGHIEGSIQIPIGQLSGRVAEIADWKEKPVLAICTVGARSGQAAQFLARQGFAEVYNLAGGLAAWRRAGY